MISEKLKHPLLGSSTSKIIWESFGQRVHIDSMLTPLLGKNVYRYAPIAEVLAYCKGLISFAWPGRWPDKYETSVLEKLFCDGAPFGKARPYAKCYSLEYSSEAMWRVYGGPGGLARIGIKLRDLLDGLDSASWPTPCKVYVGRVRYVKSPSHRSAVQKLLDAPPKGVSSNAMRPLLMKRRGFAFENEVRVIACPQSVVNPPECITVADFPWRKATKRILLDPYLPLWQCDEIAHLFVKKLRVGVPVARSSFDLPPHFE